MKSNILILSLSIVPSLLFAAADDYKKEIVQINYVPSTVPGEPPFQHIHVPINVEEEGSHAEKYQWRSESDSAQAGQLISDKAGRLLVGSRVGTGATVRLEDAVELASDLLRHSIIAE